MQSRQLDVLAVASPERPVPSTDPQPPAPERGLAVDALQARFLAGLTPAPANDVAPAPRPHRIEVLGLHTALLAFVAFNVVITLDLQPVWLDEVTVADPAVNLYLGRGFHSTGWQYQGKDEFWASNAPLHQILLFHWLKAFALSPVSVRSLNFVLMAAIMLVTWLSVVRLSLVNTWQGRTALLGLMMGTAGLTFNYCAGRYDCIGILLCVTLFFAFSIRSQPRRQATLIVAATFIPLAGVNLLPYVVLMSGLCVLGFGKQYLREIASIALGVLLGALFLYMLYVTNQVAHVILVSAGGHALHDVVDKTAAVRSGDAKHKVLYTLLHLPLMLVQRLKDLPGWYTHDRSFIVLASLALGSAWWARRRGTLRRASLAMAGAAVALSVPFVLGLARNYPFYYSWMALLPLSVVCAGWFSRLFEQRAVLWQRMAAAAWLAFAAYWGMPQRVTAMSQEVRYGSPYRQLDAFLAAHVKPEDCAYADFESYYGLVARTRYTLFPTYEDAMSDVERRELSLLAVRQENAAHAQQIVGGGWQKIAALDAPAPYDIELYRRAEPTALVNTRPSN
ncbi:MAG: hypothetical protein ABW321_06820 [Polyangiales bacterium]